MWVGHIPHWNATNGTGLCGSDFVSCLCAGEVVNNGSGAWVPAISVEDCHSFA